METWVGFFERVKGIEYLIAIAFLLLFTALWIILNRRDKGAWLRVIPILVVVVAFGWLVFRVIANRPDDASVMNGTTGQIMSRDVFVEMYGPAEFGHDLHQQVVDRCTFCHHHGEDRFPKQCNECHTESTSLTDLSKPALTHVYHLRCIGCHTENQEGPTDCTGCHTEADIPPLSIAHPLTNVKKCLSCHGASIAGVPSVPDDHSGATNGVCQLCHHPKVEPTALATRPMPHPVEGKDDCLMCHGEGIAGGSKVPEDHAGRDNHSCMICHQTEE